MIIKLKETPGCKACTGHASTRYQTEACRKRFAKLVESEKEEVRARKAAAEEAIKLIETAEAAAIRAAKASSVEPPEHKTTEEEEDPEIIRALLCEPASSRPSGTHADALPASTKKDEWVYKPDGNMLIRVHHQHRTTLTPKDVAECPVSVSRITPGRTTRVVSQQGGSKEDIYDGWAGRFSAHQELPVSWTGVTIFRLRMDSKQLAAALSAAEEPDLCAGEIPVSSGAAVTVSTASSTPLAETTDRKPSVFGNPCQFQRGDKRPYI